ncbi:MAG: hypothetical protein J6Z82_07420 [Schwartzia sp.]|nr:hypothetical protein [Schwartzia sp. (in: firmicutes)]
MGKIPRNLSDKDMFKGWQEEPTLEETMLKKKAARPQPKRTTAPEKRDGAYQTYLSQDAIDTMEKLLLEIKLDLYKQGISDYRVNVRRDGNNILLEHVPANGNK